MKYFNTANLSERVNLKEAILNSSGNSSGLYMPEYISQLEPSFFRDIHQFSLHEISYHVAEAMFEGDIPKHILRQIITESLDFEIPLIHVLDTISVLELFHGPTMAFKDVGARFMSGLFGYFVERENTEINILVATSGDTGSAVASAFLNKPGIKVTILYPSGRVSHMQEQQICTMGNNITALEIEGSFDDCQALAKKAFVDPALNAGVKLASANSINFARLFPQSFYYFHAYAQLKDKKRPLVFSVPSGNFGNLTAGVFAKRMGLPVHRFIAATNANDIVPVYLQTGNYEPKSSVATLSNAMDVGNPSNFSRLNSLYHNTFTDMKEHIRGFSVTDTETLATMKEVYHAHKYMLDPHGSVAFTALSEYAKRNDCTGIMLETAHPAKFREVVERVLGISIPMPQQLKKYEGKKKESIFMKNDIEELKEWLMEGV
jgi:threonine synthase